MNPNTETHTAQVHPQPPTDLIAVWPDETWCASADIDRMHRKGEPYRLMRVTRRGKDGAPLEYEWV